MAKRSVFRCIVNFRRAFDISASFFISPETEKLCFCNYWRERDAGKFFCHNLPVLQAIALFASWAFRIIGNSEIWLAIDDNQHIAVDWLNLFSAEKPATNKTVLKLQMTARVPVS